LSCTNDNDVDFAVLTLLDLSAAATNSVVLQEGINSLPKHPGRALEKKM